MLKGKFLVIILCVLLIGGGGYYGYKTFLANTPNEKVSAKTKSTEAEKAKEIAKVSEDDAKNVLDKNIDSIFEAFDKAVDKNKWSEGNAVDFAKMKSDVEPYVTEAFATGKLKDTLESAYDNLDKSVKPNYDNKIRFESEQSEDGKTLKVKTLEPASDVDNTAYQWEFELVYQDNEWKMNDWNHTSLNNEDLKFTQEEAQASLRVEKDQAVTFVKEYESEEADANAYLFELKRSGFDYVNYAAVSSKDLSEVTDYENEIESKSETDNAADTEATKKSSDAHADSSSSDEKETSTEDEIATETSEDNQKPEMDGSPIDGSKTETGGTGYTLPDDLNLYQTWYTSLNFGEIEEQLVGTKFGEPIDLYENDEGDLVLEYLDARYYVEMNGVHRVDIIGDKPAQMYGNFDDVISQFNPDPVYADYIDERTQDADGYKLILEGYSGNFTFISDNEQGSPIKKIIVEKVEHEY
ncbi:hypothetical protein SFC66_01945 [Terribacillus saccharophilus]|uniref:hypothetical protein n=1 Tax=Terribacillus saccharophilus TaxID=361277 RepID=UPI003982B8D9